MKTLQEIQDEVAIEHICLIWNELSTHGRDLLWPIVLERACLETAKATQLSCLGQMDQDNGSRSYYDSIMQESNLKVVK